MTRAVAVRTWLGTVGVLVCAIGGTAIAEPGTNLTREKARVLGVVTPKLDGLDASMRELVLGQLKATIAKSDFTEVHYDVKLQPGESSDDERVLKRAAEFQALDIVLGGSVKAGKETGDVVLLAVYRDGHPTLRDVRHFSSVEEQPVFGAEEAAICTVLTGYMGVGGCHGSLEVKGDPKTELVVDGKVIPDAMLVETVPLPVGEHKALARTPEATSPLRAILVRLDKTVTLRAVERCGGLSLLGKGEEPGDCSVQDWDKLMIMPPAEAPRLPWAAIGTGAASVASLAFGGVFYVQARNSASTYAARYHGSGLGSEDQKALDSYHTSAKASQILLGAGVAAAVAAGAFLYFDF